MNKTQKTILSCRVSSREQAEEGYSLDAQEKTLTDYAIKNNLDVVKIFRISESASGKQLRKMFYEMFEYATKNKVNIILCEKTDRLTRNQKDAVMVDDWVKIDENRAIHFVKENFILTRNTKAHENLMWDVKVSMARFYSNNLSEEVKKGQKEKLEQGGMPYRPPMGYMSIGEKGNRIQVINPVISPLIKEVFELYSTGLYSLAGLADIMFEKGLRTLKGRRLYKGNVHLILNNTYYYGTIKWGGKTYLGKHEPLITKELFDTVQKVMKTGRPGNYKKHNPLFKSLVICGACGHKVSWYEKKTHWYGRCANYKVCSQNKLAVREDRLANNLITYFDDLSISEDHINRIRSYLQNDHVDEIQNRKSVEGDLKRRIGRAKAQLDILYEDRLSGRIAVEVYDQKKVQIEQEIKNLTTTWDSFNKNEIDYFELGISIMELASKAKKLVSEASKEEKQEIFALAFEMMTVRDRMLEIRYNPWFANLQKHAPQLKQICEPAKTLVSKKKKDQTESDRLSWLGR